MFESLIRFALNQRIVVLALSLGMGAFGLQQLNHLSVDAFPDVTNVQVQVAAEAPGQSPEEVERFITAPLEVAMTGLPGLIEMRSVNRNSLSQIVLVFTDKTDIYFARQMVLERLIEIGSRMPEGVTPVLGPVSSGLGEVYQYTLEAKGEEGRPLSRAALMERRTIQDWVVRPMLRSIPGVAEINSMGGLERQYQVEPDPDRLRHYQLTLRDVYTAVALNNANSGGGKLPHYDEQYLIRGVGLIESVEDIEDIVLREFEGVPIHVHDVAKVRIGSAVRSGALITDGTTESVGAVVMMFRGGNARRVVAEIKAKVREINEQGLLPHNLQIVPFYDRAVLVDSAIKTVSRVLAEGIFLVLLVLLIFLGDFRSSLVVTATLLLTPLCTFMVMEFLGISANLMSLGGLAIAIGMMVDGSVVVVENAFTRLGGVGPKDSLKRGRILLKATREVARPVVFGVGIISLIFLPLMTLEGIEGKLFSPLAFTIAIALLISLVFSLSLTPVLCSYLLKGGKDHQAGIIAKIQPVYTRVLDVSLHHPKQVLAIAVSLLIGSVLLIPLIGSAFVPEMKEGSIVPGILRAPSMALEESIQLEMEAMRRVRSVPGISKVVSQLGRSENPTDPQPESESSPIATLLPPEDMPAGWTQDTVTEAIRQKLADVPGVQVAMSQPIAAKVAEMVAGVRSDVAVKVFGDDLPTLKKVADQIVEVVRKTPGAADIRVERVSGQQYLTIDIDRQAIARYGINVSDVNDVISTAIGGRATSEVYEGQRRFSVTVRYPESFRDSLDAVRQILIKSQNGALVQLNDLAEIKVLDGPAQISREMGRRRLVIGANVRGRDLGGFVDEIQKTVAREVQLPTGYSLKWGGQYENLERASKRLSLIIPLTIGAIYLLLFLLFNSIRYASLIILVLPFSSIGGIVGLLISGEYLSVPASVGFITLWGVAVLNGVVLVSYIRELTLQYHAFQKAVREGSVQRLRPVLMTASIAMLSLIPFLFATGPGSEVQRPLAIVVIGGLVTSTLLTLVVVPAIYRWFDDPINH